MARFDPFREMDRFFTDTLGRTAGSVMPMDLYRSGETFVALIDLPGADPSTIDIDVEDRTLTVRAERRPVEAEDAKWLSHERVTGTFARQLALGAGLALDRIEADYRDGVLKLTIPVAEEAKPRKITVSHAGSSSPVAVESGGKES